MNDGRVSAPADQSQASNVTVGPWGTELALRDPIPGIIEYGSLNMLAGASGVGKTCLLSWLLKQISLGLPVFGTPTQAPTKIGYLCADRSIRTARYWLQKADYTGLQTYSIAEDPTFVPSRLRNKALLITVLEECLTKMNLPPGALVVIDPIAIFMGGNLNDYQGCAVACIEIRRLLRTKQLTAIGTAHASKQKSDKKERYQRLQDRINGSGAQLGYGDTQMYLASPEETGAKYYTFRWHPHTAPPADFALGRDTAGMFVPWAESEEAAQENDTLALLPKDGTPLALAVLLEMAPATSRATLFRRLNALLNEGLIERPGEGLYKRKLLN